MEEAGGWRLDGGVDGGWRLVAQSADGGRLVDGGLVGLVDGGWMEGWMGGAGRAWVDGGWWRRAWMEGCGWMAGAGLLGLVDGGWMEGLAGWRLDGGLDGGAGVDGVVGEGGWLERLLVDGGLDGGGGCGWRAGWRVEEGWWMEGWMGGGSGMDGGMGFLNRTEPNRKKNRPEPREPKPSQNPSEKPKRTETKRGFTVIVVEGSLALKSQLKPKAQTLMSPSSKTRPDTLNPKPLSISGPL